MIPPTPAHRTVIICFQSNNPNKPSSSSKQINKLQELLPSQGQYWHVKAKQAMSENLFEEAIEFFTKALQIREESKFYQNRGECYKWMKLYKLALQDSVMAIEMDDKNIKAHLLCGKVMAEIGKYEPSTNTIQTAITRLTKAYSLCTGQKKRYFEQELSKYLYRTKKLLWYKKEEILVKEKKQAIANYKNFLNTQQRQEEQVEVELNNFIQSIGDPDIIQHLDIPIYMKCQITFEIMQNPVITEAGNCYEKQILLDHFNKNGPIDPLTRKPISPKIFADYNMKQAIEGFLRNNPWAFEFKHDENYIEIEY